ncbi:MAG: iron ABC transporter permease [Bacteroidales bacterium]|nr:iron ABC transporter permease [Bacteroidales bacterium]
MQKKLFILLSILLIILILLNILIGSVKIPISEIFKILIYKSNENQTWQIIIMQSRVPQCITALFCGASLSISGLLLQTSFHNPLAGPSILGITTGASLGVAIVTLISGGVLSMGTFSGWSFSIIGAILGAFVVMFIILILSNLIKNNIMLLIAGMMVGYVASSVISLLNFYATSEGVHSYTIWGMGNFGGVSLSQLPLFVIVNVIGLLLSIFLIKPLNAMLLGENYAQNLGINIKRIRNILLLSTGILSAIVTAYCGPISFIGLAVPHISRLIFKTQNHNIILPATMICGAIIALICNLLSIVPSDGGILPINAITPIIGAPIIIYVIINQRKIQYFN